MVIYSRAVRVAVTSECCAKTVICKTQTVISAWMFTNSADTDQTPQSTASDQGLYYLLKLHEFKGFMKVLSPVQDYFSSLHSETINPLVLLVLRYIVKEGKLGVRAVKGHNELVIYLTRSKLKKPSNGK